MMSPEQKLEIRRLIVFGAVGAVNTAVCYTLYASLVRWGGWHYNLALVADYAFGAVLGFALHRIATFADRTHLRQAFGKYALTLIACFALNFAVLDWNVRKLLLDPLPAQAIAIAIVTLFSYLMQKHWVFRSHRLAPVLSASKAEPAAAKERIAAEGRAAA
jgi:putative flippase GtrA